MDAALHAILKRTPEISWDDVTLDRGMIGVGGFADVYKGEYKGKEVAVKLWRVVGKNLTVLEARFSSQC